MIENKNNLILFWRNSEKKILKKVKYFFKFNYFYLFIFLKLYLGL